VAERQVTTRAKRLLLLLCAALAACTQGNVSGPASQAADPSTTIAGHGTSTIDTSRKEDPRLLPGETLIRSYVSIFGALAPLEAQRVLQASGASLFDTWNDYLGALGFPDYRVDLPRNSMTNALMVATFERVAAALCDAALQRDRAITPSSQRAVFDFDLPADQSPSKLTVAQFQPGFDELHRLFLGYPAALAPTDRTNRFFALYQATVAAHGQAGAPTRLKPNEAGWSAVCQGLARHPEFHLY
jgi:hypothetical protein